MKQIIKNNFLLIPFAVIFIIVSLIDASQIKNYPRYVDWQTISVLSGLIILTKGLKKSNIFTRLAKFIAYKSQTERKLAIDFIVFTSFLSMILTNDIALFIILPITLALKEYITNDLNKLIIFEAISANVGSMLLPIGNPQNLYIWRLHDIDFLFFVKIMLPVFSIGFIMLILFAFLVFPNKKILIDNKLRRRELDNKLFFISAALLIAFVVCIELDFIFYALVFIFMIYSVFYPKTIKEFDIFLIILFIIMFIDFTSLSKISVIDEIIKNMDFNNRSNIYLLSSFLSQIISNVPASIFMSKYTSQWQPVLYAVNISGNGLVIASMANVIALRFVSYKKIWFDFHKYSIPYFLFFLIIVYYFYF